MGRPTWEIDREELEREICQAIDRVRERNPDLQVMPILETLEKLRHLLTEGMLKDQDVWTGWSGDGRCRS